MNDTDLETSTGHDSDASEHAAPGQSLPGNNLTGVAVQFTTQDQKNATPVQKCIAIFNIKICYYVVLFIPIASKLEFFAMPNFESKLFPGHYSLRSPRQLFSDI